MDAEAQAYMEFQARQNDPNRPRNVKPTPVPDFASMADEDGWLLVEMKADRGANPQRWQLPLTEGQRYALDNGAARVIDHLGRPLTEWRKVGGYTTQSIDHTHGRTGSSWNPY